MIKDNNSLFQIFLGLQTKRLDFSEIKHEHLPDLFALFGSEKVTKYWTINT